MISTHSAREDGDDEDWLWDSFSFEFQPTPPARTETGEYDIPVREGQHFNPLRPRGRRLTNARTTGDVMIFQPTPPARTETIYTAKNYFILIFQPTPPARTETFLLLMYGTL